MNDLKKVELQQGVTLWFDEYDTCLDIDVEPWVESVLLNNPYDDEENGDFYFANKDKKVFPNVKEIRIGKNAYYIDFDNSMFPNVEHVSSDNPSFWSGPMLVQNHEDASYLLNTFCKKQDEVINLDGIERIGDNAFSGCESVNIINSDNITTFKKYAFKDSAIDRIPYTNGVRVVDGMLIDIDLACENVVITDDAVIPNITNGTIHKEDECGKYASIIDGRKKIHAIAEEIPWSHLKKLTICRKSMFDFLKMQVDAMPRHIKVSYPISSNDVAQLTNTNGICYVDILNAAEYKSIDGIVYSSNGKTLVSCPVHRTGHVQIPEGVKEIGDGAFIQRHIGSVSMPSTLIDIGSLAFYQCNELTSVDFGTGITEIGNHSCRHLFEYCDNLQHVDIPAQVVSIGEDAFARCGLKSVSFEGKSLRCIGDRAFDECEIKKMWIPETIKSIGYSALNSVREISAKSYSTELLRSFFTVPGTLISLSAKLTINGRTAIIPKSSLLDIHIGKMDAILDKFFTSKYVMGNVLEDVQTLFVYGITKQYRAIVALHMYTQDKTNKYAKRYIWQHSEIITDELLKKEEKDKILEVLSLGLLKTESLKRILGFAEEKGWPEVTACVLTFLKDNTKKNENFVI